MNVHDMIIKIIKSNHDYHDISYMIIIMLTYHVQKSSKYKLIIVCFFKFSLGDIRDVEMLKLDIIVPG